MENVQSKEASSAYFIVLHREQLNAKVRAHKRSSKHDEDTIVPPISLQERDCVTSGGVVYRMQCSECGEVYIGEQASHYV